MAAERARTWQPGEVVLGLYEVLDVVHSGGMGLVHRVRHRDWQVDLAVKTPRPEQVRTAEGRRRFETEAGTWVGLGLHPHTVNCVYVRTVDGLPRVFAEWVDGGSLSDAVRGGGLYAGGPDTALGRVLDIAVQMAWGLAHAHHSGLVHQDVKPANVMLEPDGTAKVTDFGLAGARGNNDAREDTESPADEPLTVTFGGMTRAYCSPEQAAAAAGHRGIRLTTATDVWSWAVSVLEMFAGRRPTPYGQVAGAALETFLRDGGPDDARVPPMPPQVAQLLRRCFAEDPADRPAGLAEVAAALRDLHRERLGTPHPRPAPKAVHLLSDGLSNQALSLLDLGRAEDAEKLWLAAIQADPHHLPSVYNFGLHSWRSGRRTSEEVVTDLEAARAADTGAPPGLGALLLGSVELERHENARAGALLREAATADPDSPDAAAALAECERRPPRIRTDLEGHSENVDAVAIAADGGAIVSGDRAGRLLQWTRREAGDRWAKRTLTRRGEPVTALAMDAGGTLGVALRGDGVPEVWDLPRGRRRRRALPFAPGSPAVGAVAVSGDGRYVATGQDDGVIQVWEPEERGLTAVFRGHAGPVTALALSRDGRRALSASFDQHGNDGTVRSWDVPGTRGLGTLVGPVRGTLHGREVRTWLGDSVALSPDARCAAALWSNGPLTLWDARRSTVVSEVPHRLLHVTTLAVATAGPTLLTGGHGEPTQVWHVPTGRCLRTLDGDLPADALWVHSAAISADGRVAVLGGGHGALVVRSLPTADFVAPWCYARPRPADELTRTEEEFGQLMDRARAHTEHGDLAAAAEALRAAQRVPGFARHPELRQAWVRVAPHGRRSTLLGAWGLYEFDGHGELTQPVSLAVSRDGAYMVTGRWTGEVDVWDFAAGERLHTFDRGEGGSARDIRFAVGGRLLTVLTGKGTIRQLSLETGVKRIFTDDDGALTAHALNETGDRILIGDEHGTLKLRNLPQGEILRELHAHGGKVHTVALSRDAQYAASHAGTHPRANLFGGPSNENEIHLWPLDADRPAWTLEGRMRDERLDFSPDGRILFVSGGLYATAWDVATGELLHSFKDSGVYGSGQSVVAFTADGRLGATPDGRTLRIWDTGTGRVLHSLSLPDKPWAFTLSADGAFAVTSGHDRLVHLWDVRSGRRLRTLEGHRATVDHVALSEDGSLLATADQGSAVWVWELAWDYDVRPGAGD
ncbi:WD40 repeat domain-containing serine/threonine protein kinase [Streptomyces sp. NPDC057565]|uniref:WD40 repeat domain-containing serine/threonine protein kinase n=1 Tax=Streptomyces sp. NPDC057565 TaxID=3346169 RepID=UPI00367D336A